MSPTIIDKIISVLGKFSIDRGWLFESCARNEEDSQSDIDILVQFSPDEKMTLFRYGRIVYNLKQITVKKMI
ncbi:MAG: nucleotidyltransferase domain-containing protein [Bacteroidales bacterium]|jgi:predicted nucleotidyltransferase|nr:nucleotidyltransferase domain-containing protein [Bacteroidales bacterium]